MKSVNDVNLPGFRQLEAAVEVAADPFVVVDNKLIQRTIERARLAPRRRARVLLHPDSSDSLHEMLIALPEESCDVPHSNFKSGKSFHVVHGAMAVMLFSDSGALTAVCRLEAGAADAGRMVRLNRPYWHTIIPLSDYVVFIETIIGPFEGNRFAEWAPKCTDVESMAAFAAELRRKINSDPQASAQ